MEKHARKTLGAGARFVRVFKNRGTAAFAAMMALLLPLSVLLISGGVLISSTLMAEHHSDILKTISIISEGFGIDTNLAEMWLKSNLKKNADIMVVALKEFMSEDGYTGPSVFDDGLVVKVTDDGVILPDGFPEEVIPFDASDAEWIRAEESVLGKLPGSLLRTQGKQNEDDVEWLDSEGFAQLTPSKIANDFYYIDVTYSSEMDEYLEVYSQSTDYIHTIEKAYNGGLFIVDPKDPTLELLLPSVYFPDVTHATELGITQEMVENRAGTIMPNNRPYVTSYYDLYDGMYVAIFTTDFVPVFVHSALRSLFVIFVIVLVLVPLIVYVASVRRYVRSYPLSAAQEQYYQPKAFFARVWAAGLAGAVFLFLTAAFIHAIGILHTETVSASNSLDILFAQLQEDKENLSRQTVQEEEEWQVYYGERIARLISQYPQLATNEKLAEFADVLSCDYLMLFDSEGNEVACSNQYVGFTLGEGQGEDSEDFRRLLKGIPSVIHEESKDKVTDLLAFHIGVAVPTEGGLNGALVMAVPEECVRRAGTLVDINEELEFLTEGGATYFAARAATTDGDSSDADGTIVFSSNPDLIGKTIGEMGLVAGSLCDGFMDFSVFQGDRCLIITSAADDLVYYYTVPTSEVFFGVLPYAFLVLTIYMIVLLVVLRILLGGYASDDFAGRTVLDQEALHMTSRDVFRAVREQGGLSAKLSILPRRLKARWRHMLPGERTRAVFASLLCLLIVTIYALDREDMPWGTMNDGSLVKFVLYGNWMRGPNLFALCGILIVCSGALLAILLGGRVLALLEAFLNNKGRTICRLIGDFLGYVLLGVVAYLSFGYLGFPTNTILGGLGLGGLALTLGSKDLVTDIIAGISIVFEDGFRIGDIVEVAGFRGAVQDIGVRSTKIVDRNGNVKVMGNADVKNVLNLTELTSWYQLDLKVPASESLERVERMLERELPKIGTKYCNFFLSGPTYRGLSSITGGTMTFTIMTECREQDLLEVGYVVNREVRLLVEREGIETR